METLGMVLIASWAVLGVLSPILGYVYDKLRKVNGSDSKFSTGRSDMRHSTLMILLFTLPLLFLGLILNALSQ